MQNRVDPPNYERVGFVTYAVSVLLMLVGSGVFQLWDLHAGVMLSQVAFILIPGIVLLRYVPKAPDFPRPAAPSLWLWVSIATPIVAITSNVFATIVVQLFDAHQLVESYQAGIDNLLRPDSFPRQIAGIVSICLVAPICEETLFRGGILRAQLTERPFAVAAVVNGLLFSALHMNPVGFVSLAFVGAYFATVSRGGLLIAIVAHGLLNFVSGVVPLLSTNSAPDIDDIALTVLLPLFVVLAFASAFCWRRIWLTLERSG